LVGKNGYVIIIKTTVESQLIFEEGVEKLWSTPTYGGYFAKIVKNDHHI